VRYPVNAGLITYLTIGTQLKPAASAPRLLS